MFKVGDMGKTRGGMDYRVICVDAAGDFPIIALVMGNDGIEEPKSANKDGSCYQSGTSRYDLMKTPVREVRYGVMYKDETFGAPKDAAAMAVVHRGYSDRAFELVYEDGKPVEARIVFVGDE